MKAIINLSTHIGTATGIMNEQKELIPDIFEKLANYF